MGFVHAWCLQAKLLSVLVPGVTPILRRFEINGFKEYERVNFALMRCTERDSVGNTQLDSPTGFFSGGVIFELNLNEDMKESTIKSLEEKLPFLRFAGGSICIPHVKSFDSLEQARRTIGFTLQEEPIPPGDGDSLERLIDAVSPHKGMDGWLMPSLMGYRMIEEPAFNRAGARGGYPHAYADPLIGIVRAEGLARTSKIPRWDWHYDKPFILFKSN
jgi:hypothetical protein